MFIKLVEWKICNDDDRLIKLVLMDPITNLFDHIQKISLFLQENVECFLGWRDQCFQREVFKQQKDLVSVPLAW